MDKYNQEWLIPDLKKILQDQHIAECWRTKVLAAKTAKHLGDSRKSLNGLGQVKLEVPLYSFHYWGQRLGYKCWKDKKFVKEFWRDNPACRVQCGGTRIQSQCGFSGLGQGSSRGSTPKFRKTYAT